MGIFDMIWRDFTREIHCCIAPLQKTFSGMAIMAAMAGAKKNKNDSLLPEPIAAAERAAIECADGEAIARGAPLYCGGNGGFQKRSFAVAFVFEDGATRVAAGGDVIDSAGIFDAQQPGHGLRLPRRKIKCQDSRPDPGSILYCPWNPGQLSLTLRFLPGVPANLFIFNFL